MTIHRHFTQTGPRAWRCNRCSYAFTVRHGQPSWPLMVAHAFNTTQPEENP